MFKIVFLINCHLKLVFVLRTKLCNNKVEYESFLFSSHESIEVIALAL